MNNQSLPTTIPISPSVPSPKEIQNEAFSIIQKINDQIICSQVVDQQQLDEYNKQAEKVISYYNSLDKLKEYPLINIIPSLILQFEAIAEVTISGKKKGQMRQLYVLNSILKLILEEKDLDQTQLAINLLKSVVQLTFESQSKNLKRIFKHVMEDARGCLETSDQTTYLLKYIINKK